MTLCEWSAWRFVCSFLFIANKVTGRERYIAPCRLIQNLERTGGWAFISGFVAVLPGAAVGGRWSSCPAALQRKRLPRTVWFFQSVPKVQTNSHLHQQPHKVAVRLNTQKLPSTAQPQADRYRQEELSSTT